MCQSLFPIITAVVLLVSGCTKKQVKTEEPPVDTPQETVYDETGCLYTSYDNLVMAGYQGWFTAQGDGADRGWHQMSLAINKILLTFKIG